MKIKCNRIKLTEALSNVMRAVSPKTTIRALEGVLLKATGNELELSSYDLEMGITTNIQSNNISVGSIVLTAKLFFEIIKKIDSETVSISCDEKFITTISGGYSEFAIIGIPPEEYPEMPTVPDSKTIILSQPVLKSMIDQTIFAVATNDSKPVHMGSLFDISDCVLNVVSVDGYRLAMRKEYISYKEDTAFVVPGKTLAETSKLLSDNETVTMKISNKHILFEVNNYTIISRLLEGEFLNYKSSIPPNTLSTATVNTRSFIDSIERTSLLISDKLKNPLKINFTQNNIEISCHNPNGKAYDEFECELKGSPVEMGFNNKYLLDALKASYSDKVRLEINGPLSPMKILPLTDDSFLFLVLPVRLRNE